MDTGQGGGPRLTPHELRACLKDIERDRKRSRYADEKLRDLLALAWPTREAQDS